MVTLVTGLSLVQKKHVVAVRRSMLWLSGEACCGCQEKNVAISWRKSYFTTWNWFHFPVCFSLSFFTFLLGYFVMSFKRLAITVLGLSLGTVIYYLKFEILFACLQITAANLSICSWVLTKLMFLSSSFTIYLDFFIVPSTGSVGCHSCSQAYIFTV